jgi:hypothetical protein
MKKIAEMTNIETSINPLFFFQNISKVVNKCYHECTILDVPETFYPNEGWVNTENTISPYQSPYELTRKLMSRIANGATWFNFKIRDEYGQIRYPDYTIKELMKIID